VSDRESEWAYGNLLGLTGYDTAMRDERGSDREKRDERHCRA
jgi:hypothetical protein